MTKDIKDLKKLISKEKLEERIKELANEINSHYPKDETLNLICVLKGAVMFFTELAKYLKMPVEMHFVTLSSYGNNQETSGKINAINLSLPNFKNKNVLIVEDIMDSGLTLKFLTNYISKNCESKTTKIVVLFDKVCARRECIQPDFKAFEIDNKFIVGFGLDYCELYRNIDYVGYFE